MKSIRIKYFAMLREKAGVDEEVMQVESANYGDLYQQVAEKYHFNLPVEMIQLAVNDEFTNLNTTISENATVVFIPPVAGG